MSDIILLLLRLLGMFTAIFIYTRIAGLRTFAKMSSVDFASTIAIGSILASAILTPKNFVPGLIAIAGIISLTIIISYFQRRSDAFQNISTNDPVILMKDGVFLEDNLASTHISKSDVLAKLRESNTLQLNEIRYVILETTGDVSVLHTRDGDISVDQEILEDIPEARGFL